MNYILFACYHKDWIAKKLFLVETDKKFHIEAATEKLLSSLGYTKNDLKILSCTWLGTDSDFTYIK